MEHFKGSRAPTLSKFLRFFIDSGWKHTRSFTRSCSISSTLWRDTTSIKEITISSTTKTRNIIIFCLFTLNGLPSSRWSGRSKAFFVSDVSSFWHCIPFEEWMTLAKITLKAVRSLKYLSRIVTNKHSWCSDFALPFFSFSLLVLNPLLLFSHVVEFISLKGSASTRSRDSVWVLLAPAPIDSGFEGAFSHFFHSQLFFMGSTKLSHFKFVLLLVLVHSIQSFIIDLLESHLVLIIKFLLSPLPIFSILGVKNLLIAFFVIINTL